MITENGDKVISAKLCNNTGGIKFKAIDGTDVNDNIQKDYNMYNVINDLFNNRYTGSYKIAFCFGNGINGIPTPENKTNYKLDSYVNLTVVSASGSNPVGIGGNFVIYTITVTNNSNEDVDICEVGLGTNFYYSPAYDSQKYLIARKVIDKITIKSGETYTFTITFSS